MKKWNCKERKYEEYNVPSNWNIGLYAIDLEELTDCAGCGKPIKIAEKYRSLEIHTDTGQEYAVCKRCFKGEWIKNKMSEHRFKKIDIEER